MRHSLSLQNHIHPFTDILGIAISRNNCRIRLTHERWTHIVEAHDYMAGNIDLLTESIEVPDYIIHGWTDGLIALKHYEKTSISEKYMVVVYVDYDEGPDVLYISFRKPQHADDSEMEDNIVYHYSDKELVGVTVIGARRYGAL